jgi:thiamine pyrophosphate-dependent acetolactate synthase large subunit-like protein
MSRLGGGAALSATPCHGRVRRRRLHDERSGAETAIRLKLNLVVLVIEDHAFGMIRWKQATDHFQDFGMTFGNPDFVAYAEAYGAKGTRIGSADDLRRTLEGRINTRIRRCISRNVHHQRFLRPRRNECSRASVIRRGKVAP